MKEKFIVSVFRGVILCTLFIFAGYLLFINRSVPPMSESAFMDLCFEGSSKQINDAIKGGAKVNARDKEGFTPLMWAAMNKTSNLEMITALINAGADVKANKDGYTPLMWAAMNENTDPEVITALINSGADVNAKNIKGFTPLMCAVSCVFTISESVTALIDAGADVNAKTVNEGWTSLMMAARSNSDPRALISAGADVNAKDNDGRTPLMIAAYNNPNPEMITILLNAGADPKAKDNSGKMAIDYAKENKSLENTEALRILEEKTGI